MHLEGFFFLLFSFIAYPLAAFDILQMDWILSLINLYTTFQEVIAVYRVFLFLFFP